MLTLGVDYASPHRLDQLRCLAQHGVRFVVRYYAPDQAAWKRLTPDEAAQIAGQGLSLVSVYQYAGNTPDSFLPGKGQRDAWAALSCARRAGQPEGTPIYFAADFDVPDEFMPTLSAYFGEVRQTLAGRYLVGVYGSYRVVTALRRVCDRYWQTYAWSGGKVAPHANLLQFRNGANLCGGSNDLDLAWGDPGWWPNPPAETSFPDMPQLKRGANGWQVAALQSLLARGGIDAGPIDGVFGPRTEAAVRAYQQARGLGADGIAGAQTWAALLATQPPAPPPVEAPDLRAEVDRLRAALAASEAARAEAEGRARRAEERLRQIAALAGEPV